MKAKLQAKIIYVDKSSTDFTNIAIESISGNVETSMHTAKDCKLNGAILSLKPAIANNLKIGSVINIDIIIEE